MEERATKLAVQMGLFLELVNLQKTAVSKFFFFLFIYVFIFFRIFFLKKDKRNSLSESSSAILSVYFLPVSETIIYKKYMTDR